MEGTNASGDCTVLSQGQELCGATGDKRLKNVHALYKSNYQINVLNCLI